MTNLFTNRKPYLLTVKLAATRLCFASTVIAQI